MDRDRVSEPARRAHRRKRADVTGLVQERDGYWHIIGTVRAGGRSTRLRRSTGLRATPENEGDAEKLARDAADEIRAEAIHGIKPTVAVGTAALKFLERPRDRPLNFRDVAIVQAAVRRFGNRKINIVTQDEWAGFVDDRNEGRAPQTRERFINGLLAFLNWCHARPRRWISDDQMPAFERNKAARNPRNRRARRVGDLTPALLLLMLDSASPHFAGQLTIEIATGARMSSVLFGCRICDLIPVHGRGQITFGDTKNGDPVTAALPDWAVDRMTAYLSWRGDLHDREAPLFLTKSRKPYTDTRGAFSGNNKSAMKFMKARAIARLRAAALAEADRDRTNAAAILARADDEAALIAQVTQHWFRHRMATLMIHDPVSAMEQGGWRRLESVHAYLHDVPARRRATVNSALDLAANLTRQPDKKSDIA